MASSARLARAAWRTSSYSNNGGECVEVTAAEEVVAVRDTRDRGGAVLAFGPVAWQRFTVHVRG